jgi:hypothetical protein
MKTIFYFVVALLLLPLSNVFSQTNHFEKVYQGSWLDSYGKISRFQNGFGVFLRSHGVAQGLYSAEHVLRTTNDTGKVESQFNLSLSPNTFERATLLGIFQAQDGDYILSLAGSGCDYVVGDSCVMMKCSPTGSIDWIKNGVLSDAYHASHGMFRFLNGYLSYSNVGTGGAIPFQWMFCDEGGNRRSFPTLTGVNYETMFCNQSNQIYVVDKINATNVHLRRIDTLGITYQSFILPGTYLLEQFKSATRNSFLCVSTNQYLSILDDTLSLVHQVNIPAPLNQIHFDSDGHIWTLDSSGILMKRDSLLNPIGSVNVFTYSTQISFVDDFELDESNDRIYFYGRLGTSRYFIKSVSLSDFSHTNNSIGIRVQQTQIISPGGFINTPAQGVNQISYSFDVNAAVVNVGNTVINTVFLNCSDQVGFYNCNKPWLSVRYDNLNLQPGDSVWLTVGNYFDYSVYVQNFTTEYIRTNFCVWPSAPNDSWSQLWGNGSHCSDVVIPLIVGVEENIGSETAHINIYPVPADDKLYFETNSEYRINQISIVDINGKVLQNEVVSSSSKDWIDVSSLPKGMYIVRFYSETGIVHKKFLK